MTLQLSTDTLDAIVTAAIWSHAHNRRDVFVTTDSNFFKQTKSHAY